MMRHVGMRPWKLPLVAGHFISLMREHVGDIRLFPGVDALLSGLAARGIWLTVVSSNAFDNVSAVLGPANTRLVSHFECGRSIFGKASRIRKILRLTGTPASDTIYIGDQITDLEAARREGVAFGAVAWGYGSIESLREHGPDKEFAQITDLLRIA